MIREYCLNLLWGLFLMTITKKKNRKHDKNPIQFKYLSKTSNEVFEYLLLEYKVGLVHLVESCITNSSIVTCVCRLYRIIIFPKYMRRCAKRFSFYLVSLKGLEFSNRKYIDTCSRIFGYAFSLRAYWKMNVLIFRYNTKQNCKNKTKLKKS